jgi:hypothetical protein
MRSEEMEAENIVSGYLKFYSIFTSQKQNDGQRMVGDNLGFFGIGKNM